MTVLYGALQPLDKSLDIRAAKYNTALNLDNAVLPEALTLETVGQCAEPGKTIAIIGNGPSLTRTDCAQNGSPAQRLLVNTDKDGNPMIRAAASGGYLYMTNNGMTPDAFVGHLPGNDLKGVLQGRLAESTIYYIASMHAPYGSVAGDTVFHLLQNEQCDLRVFHCALSGGPAIPEDKFAVGTGSGAPAAAMALFAALGHKKFEIFGMGGGFGHAAEYSPDHQYPGGQTREQYMAALQKDQVAIKLDGKVFHLPGFVWNQAEEIMTLLALDSSLSVHFHGDPLFASIFNTPDGKPRADYEVIDPNVDRPVSSVPTKTLENQGNSPSP